MFGHANSLQILTYLLFLLPLLSSAQPSRPDNRLVATNTSPQGVVKPRQSQDSVPIRLEGSGHNDKRRRSQEGQKMEDLSETPRPPRPGRVVRVGGSPPQQEGVKPAWNANPLFSPAGPGATTHSEITPEGDEASGPLDTIKTTSSEITPIKDNSTRPPYAPSSPGSGGSAHPAIVPVRLAAERWPPGTRASSSPSRLGASTHSEVQALPYKAETPSSPHTPPSSHSPHSTRSPHSPPIPHTPFETETSQNHSDIRRRCAALRHVLDTSNMTDEERRSAKFCCKFLVGSCMVGIGAGIRNQIGSGVAIGGAVSYLYALQDLYNPKKKTTATAAPAVPTDLPVKRRRSLERRKRQSMPEPASPSSIPRPGVDNQLETAFGEEEARRILHSTQILSDSPLPPLPPLSPKSKAVTPPSSHSLLTSPGNRVDASLPSGSPIRRHCTALEPLNPANVTPEQKGIAKFCCKYIALVCQLAGGVMSEYHNAAAPMKVGGMVTGISGTRGLQNGVAPSGDQGREEEMHAMHPLQNVLGRRGVEGLQQRALPPATPRAGPSNQAEIGPEEAEGGWTLLHSPPASPGKTPNMSKTPKTPKTLQPLAFASPALAPPVRRCAALRPLNPAGWTREQKDVAKFCCKYFVSLCMITAGAIYHEPAATVPLALGGLVAGVSGAGDLRRAMRTSGRPRSMVDATNAIHPLKDILRRRNRDGLKRRGEQMHKRVTPPSTPRAGTSSQAEIAPTEAEGSELVPSAHTASNPPHAVPLQPPSAPSQQRYPQVPPPPHPPSGPPGHQTLPSLTLGPRPSSLNVRPPASVSNAALPIAHLQRPPPNRRTCADFARQLDPRTFTPEGRRLAAFCCKYLAGICMVGAGALTPIPYVRWPLVGTGIAMEFGATVDLHQAWRLRQQRPVELREIEEARAREQPRREIPIYTVDLSDPPVKRRSVDGRGERGLRRRALLPRGSPRSGSSSPAAASPAEETGKSPFSPPPPPNTGSPLSPRPPQPQHASAPPSPPGSPRAATPHPLDISTPDSPTRATCTALTARLHPASELNAAERHHLARFCCKYVAGACLLGAAALSSASNPNLGLTLAAGGVGIGASSVVDWHRAFSARAGAGTGGVGVGDLHPLHPFADVLRR